MERAENKDIIIIIIIIIIVIIIIETIYSCENKGLWKKCRSWLEKIPQSAFSERSLEPIQLNLFENQ